MVHAWVGQIVTFFAYLVPLAALWLKPEDHLLCRRAFLFALSCLPVCQNNSSSLPTGACSPVMVRAGPKSCRRSLATDLRGWRRRHLVLGHVALALASLSRLKLNKLSAQAGLRGSVQDA